MRKTRIEVDLSLCDLNTGQLDWLPKNPRQWNRDALDRTVESLQEDPDWIEDRPLNIVPYEAGDSLRYVVFCGNLRTSACWELARQTAPAYCYEPENEEDRETIRRRAIKDNGTFGWWDADTLSGWDVEAPKLLQWGVPDWVMGGAGTGANPGTGAGSGNGGAKEDDFNADKDKIQGRCKPGDIWILGDHRLLCGDATEPANFALLMAGARADIAFTSPPYNLNAGFHLHENQEATKGYLKGKNVYREGYEDKRTPEDYADFLTAALGNCLGVSDDVFFNIGYTAGALKGTALFLGKNAERFGGAIIWRKSGAYMPFYDVQHGILGNITEPVYIFNAEGRKKLHHPQWGKGEASYNIIETEDASGNEYSGEHNATFPVSFAAEVINRFAGESVLDCFGGTGTTLIAAEQLGRKCYMMELDAHYCDIILARWEKMTGKEAKKEE